MTQEDTLDTLKYGHVPVKNLMEYAKTKNFDFSGFRYQDIDYFYSYDARFNLIWSDDFYSISCYISEPDELDDRFDVTVDFCLNLCLDNEEKRNYPPLKDHACRFTIKTRQEFIDALSQWEEFVQTAYGIILTHRKQVLDEVDKLVKSDRKMCNEYAGIKRYPMSKAKKSEYKKQLNNLTMKLADRIQDVIDFKEEVVEEIDYSPVYLSEGTWFDPLTGRLFEN